MLYGSVFGAKRDGQRISAESENSAQSARLRASDGSDTRRTAGRSMPVAKLPLSLFSVSVSQDNLPPHPDASVTRRLRDRRVSLSGSNQSGHRNFNGLLIRYKIRVESISRLCRPPGRHERRPGKQRARAALCRVRQGCPMKALPERAPAVETNVIPLSDGRSHISPCEAERGDKRRR